MLRFYDYPLRLRQTAVSDVYRIHQQIDTLMQEGFDYRLPYCWHHQPSVIPGASEVLVRTAIPVTLPGQHMTELTLAEDMDLSFSVRMFGASKLSAGGMRESTKEDHLRRLPSSLKMAGFELICATFGSTETFFVHKPGVKPFPLPGHDAVLTVTITDVALASQALVHGIGRRKVFGCGMLRDIEVI